MKNKIVTVFLVVALLASLLIGCGGSTASSSEAAISSGQDVISSSVTVSSIAEVQAFTEDRWVPTTIVDGFQCYDVELAGLTEVMPLYNNLDAFDLAAKMKELGRTNEEAYKALNWNGRFPSFEEMKSINQERGINEFKLERTDVGNYLYMIRNIHPMMGRLVNEYTASRNLASAATVCSEEDFADMFSQVYTYLFNKEKEIMNQLAEGDNILKIGKKIYPLKQETDLYMVSLLMSFPDKSTAVELILIGDYENVQEAFDNSDKYSSRTIKYNPGNPENGDYGNKMSVFHNSKNPVYSSVYTPQGSHVLSYENVRTALLELNTVDGDIDGGNVTICLTANFEETTIIDVDYFNKYMGKNYKLPVFE